MAVTVEYSPSLYGCLKRGRPSPVCGAVACSSPSLPCSVAARTLNAIKDIIITEKRRLKLSTRCPPDCSTATNLKSLTGRHGRDHCDFLYRQVCVGLVAFRTQRWMQAGCPHHNVC